MNWHRLSELTGLRAMNLFKTILLLLNYLKACNHQTWCRLVLVNGTMCGQKSLLPALGMIRSPVKAYAKQHALQSNCKAIWYTPIPIYPRLGLLSSSIITLFGNRLILWPRLQTFLNHRNFVSGFIECCHEVSE
jgi:hypothetical protein